MKYVGAGGQRRQDYAYDCSASIISGNTAQLALPRRASCTALFIQNNSAANLAFSIGYGQVTAQISGGVVTGFTIVNAGFGYTKPPYLRIEGGGNVGNSSYLGLNLATGDSPSNPATAIVALSSGAINAITLTNPGSGYLAGPTGTIFAGPFVHVIGSDLDPYGCSLPSLTTGQIILGAGQSVTYNGSYCPTDPVGVIGGTTGQKFTVLWTD